MLGLGKKGEVGVNYCEDREFKFVVEQYISIPSPLYQ